MSSTSIRREHPESGAAAAAVAGRTPSRLVAGCRVSDFITLLFSAFEEAGIRYCVLHGWDGLPDTLPSDLDLAVHPKDRSKLPAVISKMRDLGFLPIDCHNYEVNAQTFYFCWFNDTERRCIAVDIIFEYRGHGAVILTGPQLVADRRRYRSYWIPAPAVALRYLLAKRTLKRGFAAHHQHEVKRLLFELGMNESEAVATALFGEKLKQRVIESALGDSLDEMSGELAKAMTRGSFRRRPLIRVRCLVGESLRLLRRIIRPTGFLVAIMGPDGAGKSTLIEDLMSRDWLEFQSCRVFHWRPQFIGKRPDLGPLADPHGTPARGSAGSLLRLAGFFVDYWLGHIFSVRPRLVCSGLVIFDRYFDDITIDSKRYRYGGPSWLPRLLTHLVPRPDMVVVLDADVECVLARKREVQAEEMSRLRRRYLAFAGCESKAVIITTDEGVAETSLATRRALAARMNYRFERREANWIAPKQLS